MKSGFHMDWYRGLCVFPVFQYLDERGGCTLGGVQKGVGTSDSLYHVSQHDLIEFVKQCDIKDTSQVS